MVDEAVVEEAVAALVVSKPEAGTRVDVAPSPGQAIDLSAVADLGARYYQSGSDLWIVFADGSIIRIEDYFGNRNGDVDSGPHDVIVGGETFSGEEFIASIDPGELPQEFAEGDGTGQRQQSPSFEDPTLESLGDDGNGSGNDPNDPLDGNGDPEQAAFVSSQDSGGGAANLNPVIVEAASDLAGGIEENSPSLPAAQAPITGQIVFYDPNGGDVATASTSTAAANVDFTFTDANGVSSGVLPAGFSFTETQIRDAFSIAPGGQWTFDASALDLETLAIGESLTLVYTVVVTDGSGLTDSTDVTITVTG
ncbi:MAG: VCBS domain-containing protein, partial [Hyphomicrobiaceae bacterium]|nr:VCBS domain-containing protein [Hyphomicrobiaceae bacterium]